MRQSGKMALLVNGPILSRYRRLKAWSQSKVALPSGSTPRPSILLPPPLASNALGCLVSVLASPGYPSRIIRRVLDVPTC